MKEQIAERLYRLPDSVWYRIPRGVKQWVYLHKRDKHLRFWWHTHGQSDKGLFD